jgi:hypothetical protein
MRDLDLLIPDQQVVNAYYLLIAKGYKRLHGSGGPESALETAHQLPALVSPTGIVVELHHRITKPAKYKTCLITQNIWSRAIVKKVGKVDVQFASPEDLLIHLCEHASIHHLFNVGPLILSDINYLVNTHELDWEYILQATGEYQLTRALLITLIQVSTKLNTKIPEQVLQILGVDQLDLSILDTVESLMLSRLEEHQNMNEYFIKISYVSGVVPKLKALASIVFIARTRIANEFPVSARSLLVYLYYPQWWYRQIIKRGLVLFKLFSHESRACKLAMQKQELGHWLQDNH